MFSVYNLIVLQIALLERVTISSLDQTSLASLEIANIGSNERKIYKQNVAISKGYRFLRSTFPKYLQIQFSIEFSSNMFSTIWIIRPSARKINADLMFFGKIS